MSKQPVQSLPNLATGMPARTQGGCGAGLMGVQDGRGGAAAGEVESGTWHSLLPLLALTAQPAQLTLACSLKPVEVGIKPPLQE